MSTEASPSKTHAIVVGIERYEAGPTWNLDGPASDALHFLKYLRDSKVPAENVRAFVTTIPENSGLIPQIEALAANVDQPTVTTIIDLITKTLPSLTSDLLFFYWAGHGIITVDGRRCLFTADATTSDKRNVDLNDLMATLRTHIYPGINRQAIISDTCANYVHHPTISLPATQFPKGDGVAGREQFALLAAAPGEYAKNLNAEKSGLLSREFMNALDHGPGTGVSVGMKWPPDLAAITQEVIDRFIGLRRAGEARQTPTTITFRDWDGSEQHLSGKTEGAVIQPVQTFASGASKMVLQDRKKLSIALLACRAVSDPLQRNILLQDLRTEVSSRIAYRADTHAHVIEIVRTCADFRGALSELLQVIEMYEGSTAAVAELKRVAADLGIF